MSATATLLLATWFVTSLRLRHPCSWPPCSAWATLTRLGASRIVWGLGVGVVAAVLLLTDGLQALQTAAITAALPVSGVLLFMIAGLLKSLARER